MKKVTLIFSGGLDTTVCVPILEEEYGYDEVAGITVNVGQPEEKFKEAYETVEALEPEHYVVDARQEFAQLYLDSVCVNADYQGYPLGIAFARPVIVKAILELAEEQDCDDIAHGCTGKDNDQLRFEAVWRASDLEIIAPVRGMDMTREWEIEYAAERDLPMQGDNRGIWSIDTNLWSRSIEGGNLENPDYAPPEDIYEWTDQPSDKTELIEIAFEDDYPVTVDDGEFEPLELISFLNEETGRHGVDHTDMMEGRVFGLKVHESYEHPAATTLLNAHEALKGLVLTEGERNFKATVDNEWSQKAYEGLINTPLVDALNAFLEKTRERVTGTVTIKFGGGQVRPASRESEYAIYFESTASFSMETVDGTGQTDAAGVAKYHDFRAHLANQSVEKRKSELATDGDSDG